MWVTLHLHVRSKTAAPSACGCREGRFQQQQDGDAGLAFHHKNYFCNSIFRNCILGGCYSLLSKEGKGTWQEPSKPTHMFKGRELQSIALIPNGNSKPPAAFPCQKLAGICYKLHLSGLLSDITKVWRDGRSTKKAETLGPGFLSFPSFLGLRISIIVCWKVQKRKINNLCNY